MLDKSVLVLAAVAGGADTLAALQAATGLSRATAHRLAVALEVHGLLCRDGAGRWRSGLRLAELAASRQPDLLVERAGPVLVRLRDATG